MAKTLTERDKRYFCEIHAGNINTLSPTDIAVGCPHCNEGNSWGRKFRLHMYIKDTYEEANVKCWNCGISFILPTYLKEYYPSLYQRYRQELKQIFLEELKLKNGARGRVKPLPLAESSDWVDDIQDEIEIKEPLLDNPIDYLKGFNKEFPSELIDFVENRGIEFNYTDWFYNPYNYEKTLINEKMVLNNSLIIPLRDSNKEVIGLQAISYTIKAYQNHTFKDNWKVWNWDNINKDEKVYIFESIFDALSSGLDNIISSLGLYLDPIRLKELKQPIFCLDNQNIDNPSLIQSKKLAKEGHSLFLWDKKSTRFKDFNDLRKIGIPYDKIAELIKNNISSGLSLQIKLNLINI